MRESNKSLTNKGGKQLGTQHLIRLVENHNAHLIAPASEGGTLEVKVELEDKGEISGDDKGTRKDEKKTLSMTLYAAYPDPNDPDSDGDGIPDSEDTDPEPGPTPTPVPQPTATPGPNPTPTPAPKPSISLNATPKSSASIDLRWSDSAGVLYRSTEESFTPSSSTHIPRGDDESDNAKISYTDTGLDAETTYYYILVPRSPDYSKGNVSATTKPKEPMKFEFSFGKTSLIAGGLGSEPHQTHVKVTVTNPDGTTAKNQVISLSVDTVLPGESTPVSEGDPDADLRASLSSATATTNEEGVATVLLTSSKRIGATATVKANVGDDDDESETISMEDATGEMSIDADEIDADGESEVGIYLVLGDEANPIVGHNIRFYIDSVEDDEGQQVQPASDGTFPGYGSVMTIEGTTDDNGVAYGIYTAGTLGGTVTFGSEDTTVVDKIVLTSRNQGQSNFRLASYSPAGFQLTQLTVYKRQGTKRTKRTGGGKRPTARVSMNFFVLKDNNGNEATRPISDGAMVSKLNSVWTKRASIQFYRRKGSGVYTTTIADASTMPFDGAKATQLHNEVQANLAQMNRPSASLSVYYCKAIDAVNVGGFAARGGPSIFIGPLITTSIVAHESGHSLDLPHFVEPLVTKEGVKYEDPKYIQHRLNLMYWRSFGGVKLNTEQNDAANAYARSHFN